MLGAKWHLNTHQWMALFYLIINLPIFGILFGEAFDQKLQHTFILFVCSLTVIILMAPHSLQYGHVRRLFCWMDVLTAEEKEVIFSFEIVKFHEIRRAPDYIKRIKPFLYRTGGGSIILSLIGVSPSVIDSDLSILCGALSFYLFGVLLIITASVLIFALKGEG